MLQCHGKSFGAWGEVDDFAMRGKDTLKGSPRDVGCRMDDCIVPSPRGTQQLRTFGSLIVENFICTQSPHQIRVASSTGCSDVSTTNFRNLQFPNSCQQSIANAILQRLDQPLDQDLCITAIPVLRRVPPLLTLRLSECCLQLN